MTIDSSERGWRRVEQVDATSATHGPESTGVRPAKPSPVLFRRYLGLSMAGIGIYFLLPQAGQNLAFVASNLVAVSAILWSWRRRRLRPTSGWLLLAAFPAFTAVGNSIYFVNATVLNVKPFPSVGDAAFLGGYVLLAAGLVRLQHARSLGRDLSAALDTAIITVGFAAASWVFFMAGLLQDSSTPLLDRLTALGYPVADVLTVAVAARFFLTSGRRGTVFRWLAGTVLVMLLADTVFAVLNMLGMYSTGNPIDALILAYNLGWGAVALHRDAADLTVRQPVTALRRGWSRVSALTIASVIAPAVLLIDISAGHFEDIAVTAAAAALLLLLVVARMVTVVRALESVLFQRQALELELQHRVRHDDLTGLANRRLFADQLHLALEQRPDSTVSVLFLDLDRFKAVNDSLGHRAGDRLLVITARRLCAVLHPGDVIARLGGDEFAVLLGVEPLGRSLGSVRAALTTAVEQPVPLLGLDLCVSVSIGTAHARADDTLENLMHRADVAMYADKARVDRRAARTARHAQISDWDLEPRQNPAAVSDAVIQSQPRRPR